MYKGIVVKLLSKLFLLFQLFFCFNFYAVGFNDFWSLATQITHHTHVSHTFNTNFAKEISAPPSLQPDFKNFLSSSVTSNDYQCIQNYSEPNSTWAKHDFAHYFEQLFCNDTKFVTINRTYGQPLCELTALGQQKILEQLPLYAYKGFRDYAATLPAYPQFIRNLCKQLDNNDFCRALNKQLAQSPAFQTSNQWHERIPTLVFYRLKNALPPEHYTQKQITTAQIEAQHTYANKEIFAQHAQHVLQDPCISKQHQDFTQQIYADTKTVDGTCTTRRHKVSSRAIEHAKKHQLTEAQLNTTYGSQVMHTVHGELVRDLNEATIAEKSNTLAADIANSCVIAMEYNHAGKVYEALTIADFCYVALDYTKKFGHVAAECAKGAGLGAYDAVNNIYRMGRHPIQTAHEIVTGIGHLGYYLGKVFALISDQIMLPAMCHDNLHVFKEQQKFIAQVEQAMNTGFDKMATTFTTTSPRNAVRVITTFGVECWLPSKLCRVIGPICKKTTRICSVASYEIKQLVRNSKYKKVALAGLPKSEKVAVHRTGMFFNEIEEKIKKTTGFIENQKTKLIPSTSHKRLLKLMHEKFFGERNRIHHVFGQDKHNFNPLVAKKCKTVLLELMHKK